MTSLVDTRYGLMECLDGDSIVSRSLSLYGEWAQDELHLLARIARPGDVALDVGAFLGTHTLALANMVGLNGSVHSFEPRRAIREILERNARRNCPQQVTVHAFALGMQEQNLVIDAVDTMSTNNFGGLALDGVAPNGDGLTETIELRCLDQFGFSRIDLLKIDAEGMEADVILGGLLTLKNTRPIVFAECNDLRQGSRTWQALADLDYRIHGVISPAFDPVNFRGEHHNIFGEAAEVSLLGVPSCRLEQVASSFELNNLALIDSLDALALLLLHKPQYPEEALSGSGAAAVLGLNFKTPLSRGLQIAVNNATAELSDQSTVLAEHAKALAEQASVLAEQAQKIKTLELQLGESLESNIRLIEQNRSLERYRGTSLLNAWEQVRRISR